MAIDLRTKMHPPELAALLRDIANRVELGDSFEGNISYSCLEEGLAPGEFSVNGAYRVGNNEGQGEMLSVGLQRADNPQEDDKRELDRLYSWVGLHPDPRQGWTQLVGFMPLIGYGCVLTHRSYEIVTHEQFRSIATAHRKTTGQRVELREFRFLRTLEELE